jgi:ATP-dependent RNA helicase DDX60
MPVENCSSLSLIRSYFDVSPIQNSTSEVSSYTCAVYIVEKFLQELLSRKCQFQVACFGQNEDLCIPTDIDQPDRAKYTLARSIIFRHLTRNVNLVNRVIVKRFCAYTDAEFVQYLNESGTLFVMCHDGAMPEDSSRFTRALKVSLRAMISWFICNKFNVALINELRCSDSKV